MPAFDEQTLHNLEKLCRIDCSPEEERKLLDSLNEVLGYMESLSEIDTTNVASCNDVLRGMLKNRMRDDIVANTLSREQFLSNAPDQIGGMVRVPPVLKTS